MCACQKGDGAPSQNLNDIDATVSTATSKNETVSGDQVIALGPDAQKMAHIDYGQAQYRTLNISVKTTGEVLANANLMTHVTTPVTGRITQIFVSIGDHIGEGKPLLEIRSTDIEQVEADILQNVNQVQADLKQNLIQIDSDMATAAASIKLSESTYNRLKDLLEEKIASRADFETARTNYEKDKITLDAQHRKRDATISLSKERLKLLTEPSKQKLRLLGVSDTEIERVLKTHEIDPIVPVLAPAAGIIAERLVNVGELVDPTKPLLTIGDYHDVWIKADVYKRCGQS